MNPKTRTLTLSLLVAAATLTPLRASTVTPGDPVGGGIGYEWTVKMGENDRAVIEGAVGAWSWDDKGSTNPSGTGWTHTSDWIALELDKACRLTVRYERRDLGTAGSFNLSPAFTIYRDWEETGTESHTFSNRGNIHWSRDIAYLHHHTVAPGTHLIEVTVSLEAGKYSIVLGGNSPGADAEPNQGFTATLTTIQPHRNPARALTSYPRLWTNRPSFLVRGWLENPASLDRLEASFEGRKIRGTVAGSSWAARVTGLKPGRNLVTVTATSLDGTVSPPVQVVIQRVVASPKTTPNSAPTASRPPRKGLLLSRWTNLVLRQRYGSPNGN